MFIYQFNRLIRNRWLWGFFAFVIAFAFVGVPIVAQLDSRGRDGNGAGRLGDQRIDRETVARMHFFLHGLDQAGPEDLTPEERDALTWERLAAVQTAEQMGLMASEAEIRQAIVNDPTFQSNGQFDPARYRALLAQYMRIDPQTYEQYAAHQITMMKLSDLLSAAVWVTPVDIRNQISHLTDEFNVQYLAVSNQYQAADVTLDDDALKAYFEQHAEQFRRPERVRVRYVAVPVTNFLAAVEIDPLDVREFYDNHPDRYKQPGETNDVDVAIPFEEVKGAIRDELKREDAAFLARLEAEALADDLFRDPRDDAMAVYAAERQLSVATTDWFHARQALSGIDGGRDFVEAAFELDATRRDRRYSDVVPGRDTFYVIGAYGRRESEIPPLETVLPQVRRAAVQAERDRRFETQLETLRTRLTEQIEAGISFESAGADAGFAVSTNLAFSVMDAFQNDAIPHADALSRAVHKGSPGSVAEPVRTLDGALLVMIHERNPGDPFMAEMLREQVRSQQEQSRMPAVFADWMQWNLRRLDPEGKLVARQTDGE